MVEHIVALKGGLGLDNVVLKTNSGDPPLFDDSSLPMVEVVQKAGLVETDEAASYVTGCCSCHSRGGASLAALTLTGPDRFVGTVVSYRAGHTQDCDAVRALYRNDLLVEA